MVLPDPRDEDARLAALWALQVLDTPPEQAFDQLTRLTARTCGVPMAAIGLVDTDRVWFKSTLGLDDMRELPREGSLCAVSLSGDDITEVEDVWTDARFTDNPLVTGPPHIRFYAGAPLRLRSGHRVGSLCVVSDRPQRLDDDQRASLKDLAQIATRFLESRQTMVDAVADLARAKMEAEMADRAKSEFLAHMSHELRTPLNAVIGFADMLRLQLYGPMPDRYLDSVDTIATSGRHLLDLINDLLDLARIEAGAVELQSDWVDLAAVAHATGRMLEPLAGARGVSLRIDGRNGPRARADRRAIQQVLINIVGNAIKFGAENGEVIVEFREGDPVEIRVRDTGPGMSSTQIERAMQPYGRCQVEPSQTAPSIGGTGLGLPIARRLVELHGGTLVIDSAPGAGTSVVITLPKVRILTSAA
ncbi:MAG: GAF domain-containing sensor histidine kinase [Thalassobaculum sp.]|uniref:GAF domain-containing sensor histidine kinase n=1 Tax=Thalassobaculum sp. TaxID=2022740 RepID=UPI0032EE5CBD